MVGIFKAKLTAADIKAKAKALGADLVGIADGEYYLASDVAAVIEHTRQVIYLDDGEMAVLTPDGFHTATIAHERVEKEVHDVDWDLSQIEKGGYDHFMLKEIMEQPDAVRNATRGRVIVEEGLARLGGLNLTPEQLRDIRRIIILGSGTSWHAGLVGKFLIERKIYTREEMSMEKIREWMNANPEEGKELRRLNKSYVFFRETGLADNEEAVGAQGVSLTPWRSIAVDRNLHVYGTPIFI